MVNNDYLVDMSYMDDSGSYCDFLPIRREDHLGFKSFKLKSKAKELTRYKKSYLSLIWPQVSSQTFVKYHTPMIQNF